MADETQKLYNPNDRHGVRDGGPYADQEELVLAEKRRAAVEGREPDYDNLQPTAGVPAVSEGVLRTLAVGTGFTDLPNPIAEAPVVEDDTATAKLGKDATDEQKIAQAQAKDIAADEKPKDALEVTKAEVGE